MNALAAEVTPEVSGEPGLGFLFYLIYYLYIYLKLVHVYSMVHRASMNALAAEVMPEVKGDPSSGCLCNQVPGAWYGTGCSSRGHSNASQNPMLE